MADSRALGVAADEFADPSTLHLDLRNPRVPDLDFADESAVLEYLYDHADVDELVQSILSSGWLDYEPLIVLQEGNIVLEGNRRLAALRILSDQQIRNQLRINSQLDEAGFKPPDAIRIRRVKSRSDARDYIGFKHINGAFKWDALAKAKYAADWFSEGGDIRQISRRLGDNHNTVVRLVNGWNVLHQSIQQGFDRESTSKRTFPFSHLYTALARPNVRRFIGLPDDNIADVLPEHPVPRDHQDQLQKLMSWLYGQKNEPTLIGSQNPDLNRLVDVLGNETALTMLEATRSLDSAYEQIEDKSLHFSRSLMIAIRQAEDTLSVVGYYDGRPDLMSAGDNLRRTVLALHASMRSTRDNAEIGDAGGAS